MSNSKLAVDAFIERSRMLFSARIREKGPIFSFWLLHGLPDWLECRPNNKEFREFYESFKRLTWDKNYRTAFAELRGFAVQNHPEYTVKLLVTLSERKGWCLFKLYNQYGTDVFDMDIRMEEAENIFGPIAIYFLT